MKYVIKTSKCLLKEVHFFVSKDLNKNKETLSERECKPVKEKC